MKYCTQLFILLVAFLPCFSQAVYTGFIDRFPIELVANIYTDDEVKAIYSYTNYNEPIVINGAIKNNQLTLFEKDIKGNNTAMIVFENYQSANKQITGTWTNLQSNKKLPITLTKSFDMLEGDSTEWGKREILQPVAIGNKYFKLVVAKLKEDFFAKVVGVKIIDKKTNKLLQQFELDCQLWGLNNTSVGDYNFDGHIDFSVFEQSFSGPNTASIYFLYDPVKKSFFKSDFSGTSLEFNSQKKRVYSYNQCCAGKRHSEEVYKIVNNKMVLIKKECFAYDEKLEEDKLIKCED